MTRHEARSSSLRGDAWSVRSPSDGGRRDDRGLHRSYDWRLSQKFLGDRAVDCHRAVDLPHDRGVLDRVIAIVHSPEAPSDGGEDSWKKPTIMVQSSRDRGSFIVESMP